MKLFMIYIGGSVPGSLIELHDMRFVIAEKIEDTYADLKKSWWGTPESLHLDCWGALESADGYSIELSKEEPTVLSDEKLFFVNLGGYSKAEFTEIHKNICVVAPNEGEAKKRALQQVKDWEQGHKDYVYDVEKVFSLKQIADEKAMYIHLKRSQNVKPFQFDFGYVPIGKKA